MANNEWHTIIIGGGQAGLAMGYYLKKNNENFLIIDASKRLGDGWRSRYDSLKLFTPSEFSVLPGEQEPVTGKTVTRDEMASYLESYARKFDLPVRLETSAMKLTKSGDLFELVTTKGLLKSLRVVVATGNNPKPKIPAFASEFSSKIYQVHSSAYRNVAQLPSGDVLVVGASISGIEIAKEISSSGIPTQIAGSPSFVIPAFLFWFGKRFYWWFISNVLTLSTPMGRNARKGIVKGGAVFSTHVKILNTLQRVARIKGVSDGFPYTEEGKTLDPKVVIWCTGYQPDFSWIDVPITYEDGWPVTTRGISKECNHLYFIGMPFQYGLTSGLIGGVGRDAHYIVNHIKRN